MKNKIINVSFNVLILSLLFGIFGGISADLLVRFYWFKDLPAITTGGGELDLSSGLYNRSNIVIQDPRKVVINQDLKIQETINAANDSLFGFFKRLPDFNSGSDFNRSHYYDLTKPEFAGLALTADGWIMVGSDKVSAKFPLADYVAVGKDKKIYSPDKIVEYKKQNLWLIHLAAADNLLVKNLSTVDDLLVGQMLLAVNFNDDAVLRSIISLPSRQPIIKSSDRLVETFVLDGSIDPRFKGSWLFGLGGDLVALVSDDLKVVPVANINSALYSFLKTGQFVTPFLGVNYISLSDLTLATSSSKSFNSLGESGAVVSLDESKVAVVKLSPAEKAGIKVGDIIVSVDNVEINSDHDLAAVIQSYRPGDTVTIKFLRNDAISSADIKLGELK
ncbi:MAG: PDZ domain-containing protein [Patescibacteria group bacterium]|jgi:S1-C subfamily serine protease